MGIRAGVRRTTTIGEVLPMFGRKKDTIDVVAAHKLAEDDGYVIVDVRTHAERRQGYPPGSTHIELEAIPQRAASLSDKTVLVFCRSGNRSAAATRFLNAQGMSALNIRGGITAWTHADLPLEKG